MHIDRRRLALAALVSAVLLGLLFHVGRFRLPDLSRANLSWLLGVAAAYLLVIVGRGLSLRALAPADQRGPLLQWLQLAGRHQVFFSTIPAGLGDAGFPILAKAIAEIELPIAVRIIAQFRFRDMLFVSTMGIFGLVLTGLPGIYGLLSIALALPLLWFSDDIANTLLKLVRSLVRKGSFLDFLQQATDHPPPQVRDRLLRTAFAIWVWTAAVAAVVAAFRALGFDLTIGEALLFIAAVNIAGAVSLSIAGLGVSEAGAAAALIAGGMPLQQATSLALVVRPTLMLTIVSMALLLDVTTGVLRRLSARAFSSP
jgi:uncharacterized membrane protein YbhN (UPF0104 family)